MSAKERAKILAAAAALRKAFKRVVEGRDNLTTAREQYRLAEAACATRQKEYEDFERVLVTLACGMPATPTLTPEPRATVLRASR